MANRSFSDPQVQQAYQKAFKAYIGREDVTGIDVGYKYVKGKRQDDIAVRIHVKEKIPPTALEAAAIFPQEIEGVPVDIIQAIYKETAAKESVFQRQIRQDIIQPGLSISHPRVSAGTFGSVIYDNLSGRPGILSNWHVLVGSNNAFPGDDIIQPGTADGGRLPQDRVGQLERSILNAEGDAAIAFLDPASERTINLAQFETSVVLKSSRMAKEGDILEKSGRTTGVTQGKVDGIGAYTISYSVGAITIQGFKIVSVIDGNPNNDEISSGGDSGAIWYDPVTKEGVGLHFAGETDPDPRKENAIACNLATVLEALNISLVPLAEQRDGLTVSIEATVASLREVIDNNLFISYDDIATSSLADNTQLCREIQEILAANNFYRYRIDGLYGRRTRQALRDFKATHSVGGGDVLGPTTAEILLRFANGGGNPGRCPFARWTPITGSSGSYLGGPFKIVHHTTEGSTAAGAMSAYRNNRSDPHFTVDATTIYQHIDTNKAARSLRNNSGGVQTNRDSAIQIEVVAFAGSSKDRRTLENVARLCRWIEGTYNIPQVWPNGFPRPARNGRDPGGHNRNARNWDDESGHFGHCHVPENTHWDPAYTQNELNIVMGGVMRTLEATEVTETVATELLSIPKVEVELDNLKLITYPVTVQLDAKGEGDIVLDIAWERVTALIPQAVKNNQGVWETCAASLTEVDGQTLLVATNGQPETLVTVLVKVLEPQMSFPESLGCPLHHETELEIETVDNETPIELEEVECEAPPISEEVFLPETNPFPMVNVQLPESGTGFYSYSRYRYKQFGLAETIRAIEAICQDWFLNHRTGPLIGIGNISIRGGGPVPPHSSHQRGFDVDIRPLRSDGARVSVTYEDEAYSKSRTQELVNTIRASSVLRVDRILFNDPNVRGVQPWPGHDNHLHVRFKF